MVPTRRRKVTSAFTALLPASPWTQPSALFCHSPGSRAWVVPAWPLTPGPPVFPHPCMIMAGRPTLPDMTVQAAHQA